MRHVHTWTRFFLNKMCCNFPSVSLLGLRVKETWTLLKPTPGNGSFSILKWTTLSGGEISLPDVPWLSTFKFHKKLSNFHSVLYFIVWGIFLAFCASSGSWKQILALYMRYSSWCPGCCCSTREAQGLCLLGPLSSSGEKSFLQSFNKAFYFLLKEGKHSIIKPHFHSDTWETLLAHLPNKVNVILSQTGFLFSVCPKLKNPVVLCCELGSVAWLVSSVFTVSGRFTSLYPFLSPCESICSVSHVPYPQFIWNCLSFLLII